MAQKTQKKVGRGRPKKTDEALREPVRPIYDTMASCASLLKIPLDLLKMSKRSGCPAFEGAGRVRLALFLEWIFNRDSDSQSRTDWAAHGRKYEALIKEARYKRATMRVIDRAYVEAGIRGCVAAMFSELDRVFLNELPPRLRGCDEIQIRKTNQEIIESLKDRLRARFDELAKGEKSTTEEEG